MSLSDREIQEIRNQYEAKPKAVLVDVAVQHRRERAEASMHTNSMQQQIEQSKLLQATSIKEIDAALGGPYVRNLIVATYWTLQAGEALTSPPIENTARVTHPTSAESESGKTLRSAESSRRARKLKESVRYHLRKATDSIENNLDRDPQVSAARSAVAFSRHHKEGRHTDDPRRGCPDCQSEAS